MNIDNHYHIKHCDYYDNTDNELESVYLFLEKKIWNLDKNSPVSLSYSPISYSATFSVGNTPLLSKSKGFTSPTTQSIYLTKAS